MRDDPTRTPIFRQVIEKRLGANPESMVVLDLGTGPFALFAIIAAEAGAGTVYAVEANPAAAQSARSTIEKAGFAKIITVIEGFSTAITLPQKANVCIAEIVGSIATEEGAYATIRDAHVRHVQDPTSDQSWIPCGMQTYAAPASYTLHNLFGPPDFEWSKLNGEPIRFNCRDQGLQLLADPVLVEDISFATLLSKKKNNDARTVLGKKAVTFVVDADRIQENTVDFYDEFRRGKSSPQDSERLAVRTGSSFSGIALWPRLLMDDAGTVIDSRHYGDGKQQRSHWQTVLPIMSDRPIGPLKGGEQIIVQTDFQVPLDVTVSPKYSLTGKVVLQT
jgi:hypothetical protein